MILSFSVQIIRFSYTIRENLYTYPGRIKVKWVWFSFFLWRLATDGTVRRSNPGGVEIFRTSSDRAWGPPKPPVQWVRGVFAGVRGVHHPPPSRTEVKERVALYLYSPSGPSWPVLGRTLPYIST